MFGTYVLRNIAKIYLQQGNLKGFKRLCEVNGITPRELFSRQIELESIEEKDYIN